MLDGLGTKSNEKPSQTIDTLIGSRTEVKGSIAFSGGLRVDGKVRGNITAPSESNSAVILSEHAEVNGNVMVPHIIIKGKIKGNVRCTKRIELQPKSEITGDVQYKVIEIAVGATINGHLTREPDEAADRGVVTKLKPVVVGADAGSEGKG